MPGFKEADKREIPNMDDIEKDRKSFIDTILGDVSKTSPTKQLIISTSSGWLTGSLAMRVGKIAACAAGGGILLLAVANERGYININWDKVNKNIDKVSDRVEQEVTGESPSWMDKVCTFARSNSSLTAGFIGGFLVGLASH